MNSWVLCWLPICSRAVFKWLFMKCWENFPLLFICLLFWEHNFISIALQFPIQCHYFNPAVMLNVDWYHVFLPRCPCTETASHCPSGGWSRQWSEGEKKEKVWHENPGWALAGVAQWTECWPVNWRVAGLIPSQGTCLGCGPQLGACRRQPMFLSHTDVSLPLFHPPFLSL